MTSTQYLALAYAAGLVLLLGYRAAIWSRSRSIVRRARTDPPTGAAAR